ncbi:MAG: metal-dependent hydrolase [Acidobacteriota bacterium]
MATPLGHSLAGLIIYAGLRRSGWQTPSLAVAIVAANLPDFDFLPGMLVGMPSKYHHGVTHSLGASLIAAAVLATAWWLARRNISVIRYALFFGLCVFSHVFLDYFTLDYGADAGIPVLWPFDNAHYISPVIVFGDVWREPPYDMSLILHDLRNMLIEVLVFLPPLAILLLWRREEKQT